MAQSCSQTRTHAPIRPRYGATATATVTWQGLELSAPAKVHVCRKSNQQLNLAVPGRERGKRDAGQVKVHPRVDSRVCSTKNVQQKHKTKCNI